MNVWVLRSTDSEGESLLGVFSSRDAAESEAWEDFNGWVRSYNWSNEEMVWSRLDGQSYCHLEYINYDIMMVPVRDN